MSSTINDRLSDSYNETPYHSHPFPQTTPEHLAAVACLFNIKSVPVEQARVLELGCASGGNIIPLALRFPEALITGVDLSQAHIEEGQATIQRLGLKNITLKLMDLTQIQKNFGTFDYIIAHGVYSWIPHEVQAAMLRICGECLSKNGLAYISYNTYPGWKYREVIRDAMMFRGANRDTPQEKLSYARGMVDFLHEKSAPESLTRKNIDDVLPTLRNSQDYYLIHEFLEHCNYPCYFHEFIDRAKQHGLAYLAESQPATMFLSNYSAEIIEPLISECHGNQVAIEQHLDFLTAKTFRQTILLSEQHAAQINYQLDPIRLQQLHYAGVFIALKNTMNHTDESQFEGLQNQTVKLIHPLAIIAAQVLNERYPATIQLQALAVEVSLRTQQQTHPKDVVECMRVVQSFIENMITRGLIRYRNHSMDFATKVSEHPLRDPNACITATDSHLITTAWHENAHLGIIEESILPLLDGQHTHAELVDHLRQEVTLGRITLNNQGILITDTQEIENALHEHLNLSLYALRRKGLLID